jgi:hypothetical protein
MKSDVELRIIPLGLGFFVLMMIFVVPWSLTLGSQTTGICIYKGGNIVAFLGETGTPLRGIGVTAYFINGWGNQYTIAAGSTDRTGCFTFQSNHDSQFVSYTYNGTTYIDTVQKGVILRDNVP